MLRTLALALSAVAVIGTSAVSAQTIDLGRGGPSIDLRSDGQRERDYRRDRRDDQYRGRRSERDELSTRGGRCRTVTVRRQDDYGRTVTRRTRECS